MIPHLERLKALVSAELIVLKEQIHMHFLQFLLKGEAYRLTTFVDVYLMGQYMCSYTHVVLMDTGIYFILGSGLNEEKCVPLEHVDILYLIQICNILGSHPEYLDNDVDLSDIFDKNHLPK